MANSGGQSHATSSESEASESLSKLTAVQLRNKLRELGLKVSGKKAELVERLQQQVRCVLHELEALSRCIGLPCFDLRSLHTWLRARFGSDGFSCLVVAWRVWLCCVMSCSPPASIHFFPVFVILLCRIRTFYVTMSAEEERKGTLLLLLPSLALAFISHL